MGAAPPQIIVAGHICLDIIPEFQAPSAALDVLLAPGQLAEVGPSTLAAGGAVSNTGMALHRLGVPARLVGKIGADLYGQALLALIRRHDGAPAEGMRVVEGEHTSYTIVLSPPGVDRSFLHHTGANSTFRAGDVPLDALDGGRFFHFGYPPLMRRMYLDEGIEMAALFERVKSAGLFTSLDMARPDPSSEAGQVDWPAWLARVLPHVDLFAPSLDEILLMLKRDDEDIANPRLYAELADELMDMGAAIVVFKLGDQGLYLRSTGNRRRLSPYLSPVWIGRELLAPCFEVEVAGTTGAGDCTLAGLLAGLSHGVSPEESITLATAVGAFSVERTDSTSGVPRLEAVYRRMASGWRRRALARSLAGRDREPDGPIWHGPNDHR